MAITSYTDEQVALADAYITLATVPVTPAVQRTRKNIIAALPPVGSKECTVIFAAARRGRPGVLARPTD